MKNKALFLSFLALALVFSGCALPGSTTAQRKPTVRKAPVLPPMPPGMKATQAKAMRLVAPPPMPASVYPSTNGVIRDWLLIEEGPPGSKLFYVAARQGTNTVLLLEMASAATGTWREMASFSCYFVDQEFVTTTTGNFEQWFVRGQNIPCVPDHTRAIARTERDTGRTIKVKGRMRRLIEVSGGGIRTAPGVVVYLLAP